MRGIQCSLQKEIYKNDHAQIKIFFHPVGTEQSDFVKRDVLYGGGYGYWFHKVQYPFKKSHAVLSNGMYCLVVLIEIETCRIIFSGAVYPQDEVKLEYISGMWWWKKYREIRKTPNQQVEELIVSTIKLADQYQRELDCIDQVSDDIIRQQNVLKECRQMLSTNEPTLFMEKVASR